MTLIFLLKVLKFIPNKEREDLTVMTRLLCCALCSLFLVSIPPEVFAWGSVTHAYFAKQLGEGKLNAEEVYGATVPDLFNLMLDSPNYDDLLRLTHEQATKVKTKAHKMGLEDFALGFVSHNEVWGADFTAHVSGRTTQEGYVVTQSRVLALSLKPPLQDILEQGGVSSPSFIAGALAAGVSHPFIETAIDLLIKRNEDPSIGSALRQSAQDRPPAVQDLLAAAYGKSLARKTKVSEGEAIHFIRESETQYQQLMVRYGEIFTEEEPQALQALAAQGSGLLEGYLTLFTGKEITISPELIVQFLTLAIEQVEDTYQEELTSTLSYLKGRMKSYLSSIMRKRQ